MADIDISDLLPLSVAERIRLAEELWDGAAREAEADPDLLPLTDEERAELNRRLADYEAHPADLAEKGEDFREQNGCC